MCIRGYGRALLLASSILIATPAGATAYPDAATVTMSPCGQPGVFTYRYGLSYETVTAERDRLINQYAQALRSPTPPTLRVFPYPVQNHALGGYNLVVECTRR